MSELMVVAYPDRARATEAMDVVRQLDDGWVALNDTIAVVRDRKGKLRITQPPLTGGRAIPWRALWRRILQTGESSSGAQANGSTEHRANVAGIPETFVQGARATIERADSALIIWVRTRMPARIYEQICSASEDVLRAQLSSGQDALLYSVLDVLGPAQSERV
jgi:uncharacterized membrane protein